MRTKGSRNLPWVAIVKQATDHPGQWVMPPELAAVPVRNIEVIRLRQRAALRLEGGVIRVRLRAGGGELPGTLAIKYEPKGVPDGTKEPA